MLNDIKEVDLIALLDYMYIGEANVSQDRLTYLIKTAECLQIKGLIVPDQKPKVHENSNKEKRNKSNVEENIQSKRRKLNNDNINQNFSSKIDNTKEKSSISQETWIGENQTNNSSQSLKKSNFVSTEKSRTNTDSISNTLNSQAHTSIKSSCKTYSSNDANAITHNQNLPNTVIQKKFTPSKKQSVTCEVSLRP